MNVLTDNSDTVKGAGEEDYFVEVWDSTHLKKVISTKGKHGHLYTEGNNILKSDVDPLWKEYFFGTPVWSPDEKYIAYTAERQKPKTGSFWNEAGKLRIP